MPPGTCYRNQRDTAVGDGAITGHSVMSAYGSKAECPLTTNTRRKKTLDNFSAGTWLQHPIRDVNSGYTYAI